nr:protein translocase subunit SecF [Succinivibrionaceae bacterium]
MFKLIRLKKAIPFMSLGPYTGVLACVCVAIAIGLLCVKGLTFGLDFTGGTVIELGFSKSMPPAEVTKILDGAGIETSSVQQFGSSSNVAVRIQPKEGVDQKALSNKVFSTVKAVHSDVKLIRVEYIGPSVGEDLVYGGLVSLAVSLLAILIYVAFRFQWKFGTAAILSLVHDTMLTLGVFSLFDIEFDMTVLAALLTIIGYSLNDTIVVFDRIRENARIMRNETMPNIIDLAISQTLSRTIITSGTTLFTTVALLIFGGTMIFGFSLAMTLGICFGTFSSIYVASYSAILMGATRENLLPPPPPVMDEKEIDEEEDEDE